jgi:hypothetical protein
MHSISENLATALENYKYLNYNPFSSHPTMSSMHCARNPVRVKKRLFAPVYQAQMLASNLAKSRLD